MRSLLRFFSFGKHSVKQASALLAITSIVSNVLGLGRNVVFSRFNDPRQLDVYYSSFRIGDLIFNLLIFGAITAVVIPALSELVSSKDEDGARETANELATWSALLFSLLGVALYLAMPTLAHWIAPGYEPDRQALLVHLGRVMLLQPIIFSVSYTVGALLNGYHRFGSYSLAPLLYNLSLIVGGFLSRQYGVRAITYSVVIGSLLHLAIQTKEVYATGFRFRPSLRVSPALRQMVGKMVQPNLAQGFAQLVVSFYNNLASVLRPGSWFIYSAINNLQTTPTVVVANSLSAASYPGLVGAIAAKEWDRLNGLLAKTIRTSLFLLVPVVVLSLVLRAQVVRLYVAMGHNVGWQLTDIGIATFAYFMLGVIPASLAIILGRLFYAHKDTRTPMLIAVLSGLVAVTIAGIGIHDLHYSVATLAVAELCSSLTQAAIMLVILYRRRFLRLPLRELAGHAGSYLFGSLILAGMAWVTLQGVDAFYTKFGLLSTESVVGLFLQALLATVVGGLAYYVYSTYTGKEELQWIRNRGFSSAA